jgi:hypothetical protein
MAAATENATVSSAEKWCWVSCLPLDESLGTLNLVDILFDKLSTLCVRGANPYLRERVLTFSHQYNIRGQLTEEHPPLILLNRRHCGVAMPKFGSTPIKRWRRISASTRQSVMKRRDAAPRPAMTASSCASSFTDNDFVRRL